MDKELMFEELELMEEMVSDEYVAGFALGLGLVGGVCTVASLVIAVSLT